MSTPRNTIQKRPKEPEGRLRMPLHRRQPPGGGRWSSKRKVSVILELLRGADLETTSRKHRVTIATLTEWRDRFLAAGEAVLKSREMDVEDEEKRRLKSVVANISVDNELLRENIARLESDRPLAFWKSRP